mgnify:CR=1 FL=1
MTIDAAYTALCSIVRASSGIVTCTTGLPSALSAGELPRAIVRVGPAAWNAHTAGTGLMRSVRTYYIEVYVKPVSQGLGVDEGYYACLAPLEALGKTLLGNQNLDGTVEQVGQGDRPQFTDTGVAILAFGEGYTYRGFTMTLPVTEKTT